MKFIKCILAFVVLFAFQSAYSQGCEDPGEGDGIKFFGFIQPQYEYEINGINSKYNTNLPENHSGFFFNRARLGVMGNVPYDFAYNFIVEYAPAAGFGICDAFVSYNRFAPFLTATVGQFKTPFGAEQLQPCHKLYTIQRSMPSTEMGTPIRDMGFMLSGGTGDKIKIGEGTQSVIGYQLAYMNGKGRDLIDVENPLASLPDRYKTIAGRLTFTPVSFVTLGGSFKYGRQNPSSEVVEYDERTRVAFDTKFSYKNLVLIGEYLWGKDDGSVTRTEGDGCGAITITEPGSDKKDGYYVMAAFKIKDRFEPVVKFESLDISKSTTGDQVMRWTTGFNYYFNEWTRLQANYQYNLTEGKIPVDGLYQDVLQIQMQVVIK